jgi:hypothetical protein
MSRAKYTLPSLASPPVSFHPSHPGSSARKSFILEVCIGIVEGALLLYYAEPCVRWLASPSVQITPLAVSLWRIIAGVILGLHIPLALGIPNLRTHVEGRVILQAYFTMFEVVMGFTFGGLAWMDEEKTGLRSGRMWILTAAVLAFGGLRAWTAFSKEGWAGAYVDVRDDIRRRGSKSL